MPTKLESMTWLLVPLLVLVEFSPALALQLGGPTTPVNSRQKAAIPFEGFRSSSTGYLIEAFSRDKPLHQPSAVAVQLQSVQVKDRDKDKDNEPVGSGLVVLNDDEANKVVNTKMNLYSSSLNVLDTSPEDTQLAHSVLLVHRPNHSAQRKKPATLAPIQLSLTFGNEPAVTKRPKPIVKPIIKRPASTGSSFVNYGFGHVQSNHRPVSGKPGPRPWIRPSPRPVVLITSSRSPAGTSSPVTSSSTSSTAAMSSSSASWMTASVVRTTTPRALFFDDADDEPIIMTSNHRKYALPALQRNKLTTSEYDADSGWSHTTVSSITSGGEDKATFYPPYSTTYKPISPHTSSIVNVVSRPPLRLTSVQGHLIKDPDNVHSSVMTVLDPPAGSHRLHPNTTIVHKNVVVPYKPGRPRPALSTTTEFPYDTVLAHIKRRPTPLNHTVTSSSHSYPHHTTHQTTTSTTSAATSAATPASTAAATSTQKVYDWPDSTPSAPEVSTYYPQIFLRPTTSQGYPQKQWTGPTVSDSGYEQTTITVPTSSLITMGPDFQPIISQLGQTATSSPFTTIINTQPPATDYTSTLASTTTGYKRPSYPSITLRPAESQQFVVTRRPSFPHRPFNVATVNAILAPPMPSRPLSTPAPLGNANIMSSLMSMFGVEGGGIMSRLTMLKTALFTLLVMFLPPLTLAAAVANLL